jgi:hypothetical protein
MEHPLRELLAEIIVERAASPPTRGSGYLIAQRSVLTANHVVADATRIRVWLGAPQRLRPEEGVEIEPTRVLKAPWADLALLEGEFPDSLHHDPVLLGRLNRAVARSVDAVAAGFPRFKLRQAPDNKMVQLRERHDAHGSIMGGSNAKTRTYELARLDLVPGEDPEPNTHSPWEGMSGAGVWVGSRLVGVVAQHHPREGNGTLSVRPVEELFAAAVGGALAHWQEALKPRLPTRAWDLWMATPSSARELAVERAHKVAAALAPERLEGRVRELADLDAFARDGRWQWLQGVAFAGKTALLAWFVLHPPPNVEIVSYFLQRTTGENTAAHVLDSLAEQLVAMSGDTGYQPARHPAGQARELGDLLASAARASAERGRRLLLVLDGLDEHETAATSLRLNRWLPDDHSLPHGAAMLAASREGARLELPNEHPLHGKITRIDASTAARKIHLAAEQELDHALAEVGSLEYPIVGFLASASGGLTTADLRGLLKLAGRQPLSSEIDAVMRTSLDRTLRHLPSRDGAAKLAHAFAHDAHLAEARRRFEEDAPEFEDVLLRWAQAFGARGWPEDTPDYVLSYHARDLERAGRRDELFALVEDLAWYHRHERSDPTGHSYLGAIEVAWTAAEAVDCEETATDAFASCLHVEARCALATTSVRSLSTGVGRDLFPALLSCRYWTPEQALKIAAQNANAETRAYLLADLAMRVEEPLLTAVAREAIAAVEAIGPGVQRAWAVKAITPRLPEHLISAVLRLTLSLPLSSDTYRRPRAAPLAAIIARMAELDRGGEALEQALGLDDEYEQARALGKLGTHLPPELFREAVRKAQGLDWAKGRALALVELVSRAKDAGAELLRDALDTALSVRDPGTKSETLRLLAPKLQEEGWIDEALTVAQSELDKGNRWALVAELALSLAKLGRWRRALDLARGLENEVWRVRALAAVAPHVPQGELCAVQRQMLETVKAVDLIHLPHEIGQVASQLPEPLLREAIAFARGIGEPDRSADTLCALLPRLAELKFANEAFDLALATPAPADTWRARDYEPKVSRVLASLIPFLPEGLREKACREALSAARRIDDTRERMHAVSAFSAHLSESQHIDLLRSVPMIPAFDQGRVLKRLAPDLPSHLLGAALDLAVAISSTANTFAGKIMSSPRADALLALAPRLPEPLRSEALGKASDAIAEIDDSLTRLEMSGHLACMLAEPPVLPEGVLDDGISRLSKIGAGYGRMETIQAAAPYLPSGLAENWLKVNHVEAKKDAERVRGLIEFAGTGSCPGTDLLHRAFEAARRIEEAGLRAQSFALLAPHLSALLRPIDEPYDAFEIGIVIRELAPHLQQGQVHEALAIALGLQGVFGITAVGALALRMAGFCRADLFPLWRTTLRCISAARRSDFLPLLSGLLPVILALGGLEAVPQIAKAIESKGRWWP